MRYLEQLFSFAWRDRVFFDSSECSLSLFSAFQALHYLFFPNISVILLFHFLRFQQGQRKLLQTWRVEAIVSVKLEFLSSISISRFSWVAPPAPKKLILLEFLKNVKIGSLHWKLQGNLRKSTHSQGQYSRGCLRNGDIFVFQVNRRPPTLQMDSEGIIGSTINGHMAVQKDLHSPSNHLFDLHSIYYLQFAFLNEELTISVEGLPNTEIRSLQMCKESSCEIWHTSLEMFFAVR